MALNQNLILLLLLGLSVSSGANTPLCHLSDGSRCVCKVTIIHNPQSLLLCLEVSELELRDGKLDVSGIDLALNENLLSKISKLIINNVTVSYSFIHTVVHVLSKLKVTEINILSSTIEAAESIQPSESLSASQIKTLKLEDITVNSYLLRPSFHALHHWLFGSLTSLHLIRSGLVELDCYWAQKGENLIDLDLSENPISPTSLQNISQCCSLSYKHLKSLHLRHSNLTSLQPLCALLNLPVALTELDVSWNNFSIFHFPRCLKVKELRMLNLSHSGVTEVNSSFSPSLEELDLSYNALEVFDNPPKTLIKLNLSNNRLKHLLFVSELSLLKELNVDSNQLTVLIDENRANLKTFEQLKVLHAQRNPYRCDCGLVNTFHFLENTVSISKDTFLCVTPDDLRGTPIMKDYFKACKNPNGGAQLLRSPLCLTLFMGLLSRLIDFC